MSADSATHIHSFSSYTRGLFLVTEVAKGQEASKVTVQVTGPTASEVKTFKKVTLNGVGGSIESLTDSVDGTTALVASIAKEAFENSDLARLSANDRVSIGVPSEDPDQWLIDGYPHGVVEYVGGRPLPEAPENQELTFSCSPEQFEKLASVTYLGLNGSGLMIQERVRRVNDCFFTAHVWTETQEKMILNMNNSNRDESLPSPCPILAAMNGVEALSIVNRR